MPERYAIYFTPPEGDPLSAAAAAWLGRDAFSRQPTARPAVAGFSAAELASLTAEPCRYGFHATMKAPFELASGRDADGLIAAFEAFAAGQRALVLPELALGRLGPFFAFVPKEPSMQLQALADDCVRHFETFRAPLNAADIARRNPENLPPRQQHYLERWGYPHVFEDFRFHMTLTGPVPEDRRVAVRTALETVFPQFLGKPLSVSHLSLFIEPQRGAPFVNARTIALCPEPA